MKIITRKLIIVIYLLSLLGLSSCSSVTSDMTTAYLEHRLEQRLHRKNTSLVQTGSGYNQSYQTNDSWVTNSMNIMDNHGGMTHCQQTSPTIAGQTTFQCY